MSRERSSNLVLALGIFDRPTSLRGRVEALLRPRRGFSAGFAPRRVLSSAVALLSLAGVASLSPRWIAVAQELPSFEAVSIKVHKGGGGTTRRVENASITFLNITLGELLYMSNDVKPYQISAPEWIAFTGSTDRYDFIAKAASPLPAKDLWAMAVPVLIERFKIKLHRETKDLPVFALLVAPGGPKFKAGDGGEPNISRAPEGFSYANASMDQFAANLSAMTRALGRPVLNRTGLQGTYTFVANLQGLPAGLDGEGAKAALIEAASAPDSPLMTNIRDQLGLRLEATRAPMEVIVVDHAEKVPEEN